MTAKYRNILMKKDEPYVLGQVRNMSLEDKKMLLVNMPKNPTKEDMKRLEPLFEKGFEIVGHVDTQTSKTLFLKKREPYSVSLPIFR